MKKTLITISMFLSTAAFASDAYLNCMVNEHNVLGTEENPIQSTPYSAKIGQYGAATINANGISFPVSVYASSLGDSGSTRKYKLNLVLNQIARDTTVSTESSVRANDGIAKLKLQITTKSGNGMVVLFCKISNSAYW